MAPFDLDRFVDAQAQSWPAPLAELKRGRKTGHWMWWIFPQIAGLGYSATSVRYAIGSLDEARAYLRHPVLGPRLREAVVAVTEAHGSAEDVFGTIDAVKLRSSLTLFAAAAPDGASQVFDAALRRFFAGERDEETLGRLNAPPQH